MENFGSKGDLSYGGQVDLEKAKAGVRTLLEAFGLDTESPDLIDTPRRVAEAYAELFAGLFHTPPRFTMFDNDIGHGEMVLLKGVHFVSICGHHLMPFAGRAHVAYVPHERIVGLSKLARIVSYYAARPQLQERLTTQVAESLEAVLQPKGVAVIMAASHNCLSSRGASKPDSSMVTTVMRGCFKDANSQFRDDLLRAVERP